jgi:uncharacterized repeat protein (TIGR01451 family)/CSLREA domain-containing protein
MRRTANPRSLVLTVIALAAGLTAFSTAGATSSALQATVFTVNSTADTNDGDCTAADCTLREAIIKANATSGTDTIAFDLAGTAPHTISPGSALPAVSESVVIDGTTQPGFTSCTDGPVVELDGSNAGASANGVWLAAPSTVRGLAINRFTGTGSSAVVITGAAGSAVECSYLGTDLDGTSDLGNYIGVFPQVAARIGGTAAGAGNVISGNLVGIYLSGSGVQVQGNLIGTDAAGAADLGNSFEGIFVDNGSGNTIGGTAPGAGNVISGNNATGVRIQGPNNQVLGNRVGTAADGTSALGNGQFGIQIGSAGAAAGNTVGGTTAGAGNIVAFNGFAGVFVQDNANAIVNNRILANSIFSNGSLGIDLAGGPVTPNDLGDGDDGANHLQNFPVLASAASNGSSTTVEGDLNSAASTSFRIEFFSSPGCDASGYGEGKTYLGFLEGAAATTDASGNLHFSAVLAVGAPVGHAVTATATDPNGNTSEFSACKSVTAGGNGGASADIVVGKSDHVDPVAAGDNLGYTITVQNSGPDNASGVVVSDPLPAGTTFVSASDGGTFAAGDVTWNVGAIAAGTYVNLTLVVSVDQGRTAPISNSATASSTSSDPNPGNNTGSEETAVTGAATGTIIVRKNAIPDDAQDFDFSAGGGLSPSFTLDDDPNDATLPNEQTFNNVPAGSGYSVAETLPAGWQQTSATCSDGSTPSNINLSSGETVTCTFTNTKQGAIVIRKTTVGGDGTFAFDGPAGLPSPANPAGDFAISTAANTGSATLPNVGPGSYAISETVPAGWQLTAAPSCDDGSSPNPSTGSGGTATVRIDPGETVACTFSNTRQASITIVKDAVPNHAQDFGYTTSGAGLSSFSLDDDGDETNALPSTKVFAALSSFGAKTVGETVPPGWAITGIACSGDSDIQIGSDGDFDPGDTGVTIDLDPGENVVCTFTNKPGVDLVIMKLDSPDPVEVGRNLVYSLTVQNRGPGDAQGVEVAEPIPTGTTFVAANDPAYSSGTGRWQVGALVAGASRTLQLTVSVNRECRTTLTNTAAVTSTTALYNTSDDSATAQTAIQSVSGSPLNDVLIGGPGNNTLQGGGGDDVLCGMGGDDTLIGGPGNDLLIGGDGNGVDSDAADGLRDAVSYATYSGAATGWLIDLPARQARVLDGGTETDTLAEIDDAIGSNVTKAPAGGRAYNDRLIGDGTDNHLSGGSGIDSITGGAGDDTIQGDADADRIFGDAGNDTINGGDQRDTINGNDGNDNIYGDTPGSTGGAADIIGGDAGGDTIYGAQGNDTIDGDAGNDKLDGADDNDTVRGGDDNDKLEGGRHTDALYGGNGKDEIWGDMCCTLSGGLPAGDDKLYGQAGNDELHGQDGKDDLFGGDGSDKLFGDTGADLLDGGPDPDNLDCGTGTDDYVFAADDTVSFNCENRR